MTSMVQSTESANQSSASPTSHSTKASEGTTVVHSIPTQKLSALSRFKSLGRKKSSKRPALVFPPPSWSLDGDGNGAGASVLANRSNTTDQATSEIQDPPEPKSFARKIQELTDSLPIPGSEPAPRPVLNSTATIDNGKTTTPPVLDPKGPPVPNVVDSKLMKLLSSESVMNGSLSRGRQSVWDVLDRLKPIKGRIVGTKGGAEEMNEQDRREQEMQEEGGVMMYSPIVPTQDSEVEIAESVLEYVDADEQGRDSGKGGEGHEAKGGKDGKNADQNRGKEKRRWPFTGRKGAEMDKGKEKEQEKGKEKETQHYKENAQQNAGVPKVAKEEQEETTKEKKVNKHRVWLPSNTKISLQAMWWGYRIYLPPPVLAILDNAHIVAAKRAALITAALKWLLDHVPTLMVPPQLRPGLALLRRLSPVLGYIGVFIAWSWGAIKEKDKGHGVILTATWLLPVALLPATWEPGNIPGTGPPVQGASSTNDKGKAAKDSALKGKDGSGNSAKNVSGKSDNGQQKTS